MISQSQIPKDKVVAGKTPSKAFMPAKMALKIAKSDMGEFRN